MRAARMRYVVNRLTMAVLMRAMLAGLASFLLFGMAGCTKTSDGSIEFHRPHMTGLFGSMPQPADSVVAMAFPQPPPPSAPPSPQVTLRRKPPARPVRQNRVAPSQSAAVAQADLKPEPTLNCREQAQAGGRVKFVCR
jgi:hypothetical protein